ncbi:uncharacterized protein L201_001187 [Kwoniella dendrophila CBS 6074]|uniref:Uncharacterized protein n=1 Tax=Kwoniella dendrophila CBS 6074 TaxID=1295534 RepID=A0AAX4JN45_9TREE
MSSPVKAPSLPSRSSSQLSLDSHLSSPRKRQERSRPSLDRNGIRPPSAIYLGEEPSSSSSNSNRRQSSEFSGVEEHPPHMRMTSGFASLHVGIGSPKLDFGRRDWPGSSSKRKEESNHSSENSPEVKQEETISSHQHQQQQQQKRQIQSTESQNGLVDRVSGLPSPPGTESDITPPADVNSPSDSIDKLPSPVKSHSSTPKHSPNPKTSRRTSSTGSAHLLARRTSSRSASSTHIPDSPRLRNHALRPKHSPSLSMSRSGSSSSSLIASPSMNANRSLNGSTRRSSMGMSRTSSHSPSLSLAENTNITSSSLSKRLPPVDVKRANSPEDTISSPERTARKLPPVSAGLSKLEERRHSRRSSNADLRDEVLEEEIIAESGSMSRSRSQGSELDDKIREAEERIAQASIQRRRRSIDVEKSSTPSRQSIRRHDSYTRTTSSPLVPSTGSTSRDNRPSNSVRTDSHSSSLADRENAQFDTPEKGEEDRERSGGSNSSRRRKGLPAEFRSSNNLFTPSPQKPKYEPIDDQPGSSRSARLRQFIDSPSDYHSASPIPSRFSSTTSRRSGEFETVPLPSRGLPHIDGLERSSSLGGTRGETSGYSKRNWSQSISGLPRPNDETEYRSSPRDRYRSETVLGGSSDRSTYQSRMGDDRDAGRRGMSTVISERDLLATSRSRVGALGPGDSVSAVGSRNDRSDNKDPLEMIKKLEQQRAESKRRWDHMPRSTTSMSSMRDVYHNPPNTAPIEGSLRYRRSIDQDSPLSPPFVRGGASRLAIRNNGGPSTEPRPMRSSTSLGGRSSANFELTNPSTEHGRLLFEAFKVLETKLGQELLSTQPELLRTFHSTTKTSESINAYLRHAIQLASEIAVDAELDDPAKVKEEYSKLAFILRDAGKASEHNVRDMTRLMLDLPKLFKYQEHGIGAGSGMTSSTSGGLSLGSGRLRRSESAALNYNYDPVKQGVMSEDRPARIWQPTSPVNQIDRSPLQGRWSVDTPRRSYDLLRSSTSMADTHSPLSRYSRDRSGNNNGNGNNSNSRPGSTVSSLMSKVRSMTPRKSFQQHSPSKVDLSVIEQSPPFNRNDGTSSSSKSPSKSPDKPSPDKEKQPLRNMLRKKTSTLSTNTIKGSPSSNFLPTSSSNKPTTAISQITAGDLSPDLLPSTSANQRIPDGDGILDEPNSPMSRFSFHSQRSQRKLSISKINTKKRLHEQGHSRNGSSDTFGTNDSYFPLEGQEQNGNDREEEEEEEILTEEHGQGTGYENDAVSMLEQRLVQAAKLRDESQDSPLRNKRGLGIDSTSSTLDLSERREDNRKDKDRDKNEIKRPSISDRFRASLRKSSSKLDGRE